MRKRILVVFAGVAGALLSASVSALTYVPVPDAALVDGAEIVARVELSSGRVANVDGRIVTRYDATVLELLKGRLTGSRIVVEVPGGIDRRADRAVHIAGMPSFRSGERSLVFLGRAKGDAYRLLHLSQGAFREVETAAGPILLRNLAEAWEARRNGDEISLRPGHDVARDRGRFVEWVRDRAAGRHRAADYLVEMPAAELAAHGAKFTLLGPVNLTGRWFVFDEGQRLRWFRHVDGQPGLAGGGRKEFTRARKAWNRTRTPINLIDGGTTGNSGGFVSNDGRNTILFSDLNESIGTDFDCANGGILAIGGFSDTSAGPRDYKTLGVFEAFEAEIVVNDGVECFFADSSRSAAQVYAHELGHTLGLGHSCGDGASPRCGRSVQLDEALMRASLEEVFGAQLATDDETGIRMLYDDDFYAVACETTAPGARRFCRQCGPCGAGQGNCRNDADCAFGILKCEKNVGAEFGFSPATNVCVPR